MDNTSNLSLFLAARNEGNSKAHQKLSEKYPAVHQDHTDKAGFELVIRDAMIIMYVCMLH